jgi:hypothetical protein
MASLWIPRGAQKPIVGARVNPSHPLAAGLHRLWPFNDGVFRRPSRTAVDVVKGDVLTHSRQEADVRYVSGAEGMEFESGADGDKRYMTPSLADSFPLASSLTVACWFRPHTSNGFLQSTNAELWAGNNNSAWAPRLEYTSTSIVFRAVRGGVGDYGVTFSTTITAGVNYFVVARYARDTSISNYAGTWDASVNGVWSGTNNRATATGFSGTFGTDIAYVGASPSADTAISNHIFYRYLAVWSRALDKAECAALRAEPYAMLTR